MTDRERVLALLRRHGWNSTSFQILEPGFRYWFDGDDACVGYVDTGRSWVVAGPPIAPVDRLAEVATRFADAARTADRRTAWFGTEPRFSGATTWPSLRIGDQPVWSPVAWAGVVENSKSLRICDDREYRDHDERNDAGERREPTSDLGYPTHVSTVRSSREHRGVTMSHEQSARACKRCERGESNARDDSRGLSDRLSSPRVSWALDEG